MNKDLWTEHLVTENINGGFMGKKARKMKEDEVKCIRMYLTVCALQHMKPIITNQI